jgi:hypothetical protein
MPENQIGPVWKWITAGIAILSGAFGAGKFNAAVVKKSELYDPKTGSQLYLTVEKSKENMTDCKGNMAKELAEIKTTLGKVTEHIKITNEERIKTANLMGRIEEFMINNRKDH